MSTKNSLDSLEVAPTGGALGAEIRGVDLAQPMPEEVKEALRDAWTEHLVLLFRDQEMSEEQHLDATRIFGEAVAPAAKAFYDKAGKEQTWAAKYPEITVVHNLDENGNPVQQNESLGSGEVVWHDSHVGVTAEAIATSLG